MLEFVKVYLIEHTYGMSYVLTAGAYLLSCVLLFREWKKRPQCYWYGLRDLVLLMGAWVVLCSAFYFISPGSWFSLPAEFLLLLLYGLLASKRKVEERVVQQVTLFTCFILILRISESIGNFTDKLGWKYRGVSMTDVTMMALMLCVVWYLRRFRVEDVQMLPRLYPLLMTAICVLAVSTQLYSMMSIDPSELEDASVRGYNLYMGASFLVIILLGYYLYYAIGREHTEKIMLLAQQRRQELDEENMIAAQQTYEALREVRHEIKNHTAYIPCWMPGITGRCAIILTATRPAPRSWYTMSAAETGWWMRWSTTTFPAQSCMISSSRPFWPFRRSCPTQTRTCAVCWPTCWTTPWKLQRTARPPRR